MNYNTKALLLSAGLGSRLRPLTDIWPKCLMPIRSRPLLEYWLSMLSKNNVQNVLVNTHYLSKYVNKFLTQDKFKNWVDITYEKELLGTAGTVRKNKDFYKNSTLLLIHADNWVCCNFTNFLNFHHEKRDKNTLITMMTFTCDNPAACGIVELDKKGIVINFHEKVEKPPGNLANAAIYLIEPQVVEWIANNPDVNDFSTEVLPYFLGQISTWENKEVHRDIGTIEELKKAQIDNCDLPIWTEKNTWQQSFNKNIIQELVK